MATNQIRFECPKCECLLNADESEVGQKHTCPRCGNVARVPAAPPAPPAATGAGEQWITLPPPGADEPGYAWEGRPSAMCYLGNFVVGGFLVLVGAAWAGSSWVGGMVALVIGGAFIGYALVDRACTSYRVDARTVRIRRGVFFRQAAEIGIDAIRYVQLEQGLSDRMFDVGNVRLLTAAGGRWNALLRGVATPAAVVQLINNYIGVEG